MGTRKREIVEFVGLKTYFFPNIALYAECNDELIAKTPEKANPVVSYIFGGIKEAPSEQQIIDILLPDNANPETLYTGMDTCLALGGHFIDHFKSLIPRLTSLKYTHDLAEMIQAEDTKRLHLIGRKARLQKGPAARILFMLVKIMMAEDNETKFSHLYDLCEMELEFDAFVFIKLLGLENEKNIDDVEEIRAMVMEKINPQLKELMIYGVMDDFTRLLITYPIEKSAHKLISHRVDLYKHILSAEEEDGYPNSDMKKRQLNFQLIFLISRALASGNLHVAKQMITWIPGSIRKEMFPGLQNNRAEKTLEYLDSIIKIFMSSSTPVSFKSWSIVGINEFLDNPWSRRAIVCVLDSFSFAVTHEVFEELSPPMVPNSDLCNGQVVSKMEKSLQCATWIVENYQNFDEKSIQKIQFLDNRKEFVEDLKKAMEDPQKTIPSTRIHVEEQLEYVKIKEAASECVLKTEDFGIVSSPREYVLKTEDFALSESADNSSKDSTEGDGYEEEEETSEEDEKNTKFFTEVASKLTEWDKTVKKDWLEEKLDEALPGFQSGNQQKTKKDVLKLQNGNRQNVRVNHNNNIEKPRHNTVRTNYTPSSESSLDTHVGWMDAEKPMSSELTHEDILSMASGDRRGNKAMRSTLDFHRSGNASSPPVRLYSIPSKYVKKLEKNTVESAETLEERIARRQKEEEETEIFNSPKLTKYDVLSESKSDAGAEKMVMKNTVPSHQTEKKPHPPYPPVHRRPAVMEELLKHSVTPPPSVPSTPSPLSARSGLRPAPILRGRPAYKCTFVPAPRPPLINRNSIIMGAIRGRRFNMDGNPKCQRRRLFGGVGIGELPAYSGYI